MRSFVTFTFHQVLGLPNQEDEMGGACSTNWSDAKFIQYFGLKTCRKETTCKT